MGADGPPATLRFFACAARGPLETQVLLLCRSIRQFAGALRAAPITVLTPSRVEPPTASTQAALAQLDVEFLHVPINDEYPELPFANKVSAGAQLEERCREDVIVFVDSDSIFTAEPRDLLLPAGHAAAVRPVNSPQVASTGPGGKFEPFWDGVHRLCGTSPPPFIRTAVSGDRIRAFFNTGLVAVRREARVMTEWRRDFLRLMRARQVPASGKINQMEQVALSVALARRPDEVHVLDARYNYALPLRERMEEPQRSAALEDLVHVHYFRSLHEAGFLERLGVATDGPVGAWLNPHLPLEPAEYAHAPRESYRLPNAPARD